MFATSSRHDVRVWHASTGQELLRIKVPNLLCNALDITPDGKAIITGKQYLWKCKELFIVSAWDDGKIRAFLPETGKPIYTIHDAHSKVSLLLKPGPIFYIESQSILIILM